MNNNSPPPSASSSQSILGSRIKLQKFEKPPIVRNNNKPKQQQQQQFEGAIIADNKQNNNQKTKTKSKTPTPPPTTPLSVPVDYKRKDSKPVLATPEQLRELTRAASDVSIDRASSFSASTTTTTTTNTHHHHNNQKRNSSSIVEQNQENDNNDPCSTENDDHEEDNNHNNKNTSSNKWSLPVVGSVRPSHSLLDQYSMKETRKDLLRSIGTPGYSAWPGGAGVASRTATSAASAKNIMNKDDLAIHSLHSCIHKLREIEVAQNQQRNEEIRMKQQSQSRATTATATSRPSTTNNKNKNKSFALFESVRHDDTKAFVDNVMVRPSTTSSTVGRDLVKTNKNGFGSHTSRPSSHHQQTSRPNTTTTLMNRDKNNNNNNNESSNEISSEERNPLHNAADRQIRNILYALPDAIKKLKRSCPGPASVVGDKLLKAAKILPTVSARIAAREFDRWANDSDKNNNNNDSGTRSLLLLSPPPHMPQSANASGTVMPLSVTIYDDNYNDENSLMMNQHLNHNNEGGLVGEVHEEFIQPLKELIAQVAEVTDEIKREADEHEYWKEETQKTVREQVVPMTKDITKKLSKLKKANNQALSFLKNRFKFSNQRAAELGTEAVKVQAMKEELRDITSRRSQTEREVYSLKNQIQRFHESYGTKTRPFMRLIANHDQAVDSLRDAKKKLEETTLAEVKTEETIEMTEKRIEELKAQVEECKNVLFEEEGRLDNATRNDTFTSIGRNGRMTPRPDFVSLRQTVEAFRTISKNGGFTNDGLVTKLKSLMPLADTNNDIDAATMTKGPTRQRQRNPKLILRVPEPFVPVQQLVKGQAKHVSEAQSQKEKEKMEKRQQQQTAGSATTSPTNEKKNNKIKEQQQQPKLSPSISPAKNNTTPGSAQRRKSTVGGGGLLSLVVDGSGDIDNLASSSDDEDDAFARKANLLSAEEYNHNVNNNMFASTTSFAGKSITSVDELSSSSSSSDDDDDSGQDVDDDDDCDLSSDYDSDDDEQLAASMRTPERRRTNTTLSSPSAARARRRTITAMMNETDQNKNNHATNKSPTTTTTNQELLPQQLLQSQFSHTQAAIEHYKRRFHDDEEVNYHLQLLRFKKNNVPKLYSNLRSFIPDHTHRPSTDAVVMLLRSTVATLQDLGEYYGACLHDVRENAAGDGGGGGSPQSNNNKNSSRKSNTSSSSKTCFVRFPNTTATSVFAPAQRNLLSFLSTNPSSLFGLGSGSGSGSGLSGDDSGDSPLTGANGNSSITNFDATAAAEFMRRQESFSNFNQNTTSATKLRAQSTISIDHSPQSLVTGTAGGGQQQQQPHNQVQGMFTQLLPFLSSTTASSTSTSSSSSSGSVAAFLTARANHFYNLLASRQMLSNTSIIQQQQMIQLIILTHSVLNQQLQHSKHHHHHGGGGDTSASRSVTMMQRSVVMTPTATTTPERNSGVHPQSTRTITPPATTNTNNATTVDTNQQQQKSLRLPPQSPSKSINNMPQQEGGSQSQQRSISPTTGLMNSNHHHQSISSVAALAQVFSNKELASFAKLMPSVINSCSYPNALELENNSNDNLLFYSSFELPSYKIQGEPVTAGASTTTAAASGLHRVKSFSTTSTTKSHHHNKNDQHQSEEAIQAAFSANAINLLLSSFNPNTIATTNSNFFRQSSPSSIELPAPLLNMYYDLLLDAIENFRRINPTIVAQWHTRSTSSSPTSITPVILRFILWSALQQQQKQLIDRHRAELKMMLKVVDREIDRKSRQLEKALSKQKRDNANLQQQQQPRSNLADILMSPLRNNSSNKQSGTTILSSHQQQSKFGKAITAATKLLTETQNFLPTSAMGKLLSFIQKQDLGFVGNNTFTLRPSSSLSSRNVFSSSVVAPIYNAVMENEVKRRKKQREEQYHSLESSSPVRLPLSATSTSHYPAISGSSSKPKNYHRMLLKKMNNQMKFINFASPADLLNPFKEDDLLFQQRRGGGSPAFASTSCASSSFAAMTSHEDHLYFSDNLIVGGDSSSTSSSANQSNNSKNKKKQPPQVVITTPPNSTPPALTSPTQPVPPSVTFVGEDNNNNKSTTETGGGGVRKTISVLSNDSVTKNDKSNNNSKPSLPPVHQWPAWFLEAFARNQLHLSDGCGGSSPSLKLHPILYCKQSVLNGTLPIAIIRQHRDIIRHIRKVFENEAREADKVVLGAAKHPETLFRQSAAKALRTVFLECKLPVHLLMSVVACLPRTLTMDPGDGVHALSGAIMRLLHWIQCRLASLLIKMLSEYVFDLSATATIPNSSSSSSSSSSSGFSGGGGGGASSSMMMSKSSGYGNQQHNPSSVIKSLVSTTRPNGSSSADQVAIMQMQQVIPSMVSGMTSATSSSNENNNDSSPGTNQQQSPSPSTNNSAASMMMTNSVMKSLVGSPARKRGGNTTTNSPTFISSPSSPVSGNKSQRGGFNSSPTTTANADSDNTPTSPLSGGAGGTTMSSITSSINTKPNQSNFMMMPNSNGNAVQMIDNCPMGNYFISKSKLKKVLTQLLPPMNPQNYTPAVPTTTSSPSSTDHQHHPSRSTMMMQQSSTTNNATSNNSTSKRPQQQQQQQQPTLLHLSIPPLTTSALILRSLPLYPLRFSLLEDDDCLPRIVKLCLLHTSGARPPPKAPKQFHIPTSFVSSSSSPSSTTSPSKTTATTTTTKQQQQHQPKNQTQTSGSTTTTTPTTTSSSASSIHSATHHQFPYRPILWRGDYLYDNVIAGLDGHSTDAVIEKMREKGWNPSLNTNTTSATNSSGAGGNQSMKVSGRFSASGSGRRGAGVRRSSPGRSPSPTNTNTGSSFVPLSPSPLPPNNNNNNNNNEDNNNGNRAASPVESKTTATTPQNENTKNNNINISNTNNNGFSGADLFAPTVVVPKSETGGGVRKSATVVKIIGQEEVNSNNKSDTKSTAKEPTTTAANPYRKLLPQAVLQCCDDEAGDEWVDAVLVFRRIAFDLLLSDFVKQVSR